MFPHIPLHKITEPHWIPRDELKESSLHLLEQQEKEYNERLQSIANLSAPEPIGTMSTPISHRRQTSGSFRGRRSSNDSVIISTPILSRPASSRYSRRTSEDTATDTSTNATRTSVGNSYQSSRRSVVISHGQHRRYRRSGSSGVGRRRSYEEAISFENDGEEEGAGGNSDAQMSFSSDVP